MIMKNKLEHFPISFFAMVMGCTGFAMAAQKIQTFFTPPKLLLYAPLLFSTALFLVITLIYLMKFFVAPENVKKEFNHPIKIHFFPTFSISLLLLSSAYLDMNHYISKFLWAAGTFLHLLFTIAIVSRWMHHTTFKIIHLNPSWFIPAVGNILIPLSGIVHGPRDVSWFFFSIGFIFWVILLVVVFYRIIFHEPMEEKLLPTLFILIAPPAVGFIALYKLSGSINDFGKVLYFFALFLTMLLFTQFRIFKKIKFFLSSWAYSFPLAAICNASFIMYNESKMEIYKHFYFSFLILVLLLISKFTYQTYVAIRQNQICVEEH